MPAVIDSVLVFDGVDVPSSTYVVRVSTDATADTVTLEGVTGITGQDLVFTSRTEFPDKLEAFVNQVTARPDIGLDGWDLVDDFTDEDDREQAIYKEATDTTAAEVRLRVGAVTWSGVPASFVAEIEGAGLALLGL